MRPGRTTTGRARTILVFGEGDTASAVVSSVIARLHRGTSRSRLVFTGSVGFNSETIRHLNETVVPVADRINEHLGITRRTYEISLVNAAVASVVDLGLTVSGFSADVPVLLAILSSSLRIPLPQDTVTTGHIASPDGDIRSVRSIAVKLAAAEKDPSIRVFVYPSSKADISLTTLCAGDQQGIEKAVDGVDDRLRVTDVSDIGELLRETLNERTIVLGSLRTGFWGTNQGPCEAAGPVDDAVSFLTDKNGARFWSNLESCLFLGQSRLARELLATLVRYHIKERAYPGDFGQRLHQLVQSLPPATRRLKTSYPLVSTDLCVHVSRFAGERDHEDVHRLFAATTGGSGGGRSVFKADAETGRSGPADAVAALDAVVAEISADALALKIGRAIDEARAAYIMDSVTVDSHETFLDSITAFYHALLRHVGTVSASLDEQMVAAEALALVDRAFAKKGGSEAALAEANFGVNGGMRLVLDVMTEQYKAERQMAHVNRILKEAIDPLDWNSRVVFMSVLLQRIGGHLPEEIRDAPPQRFARQYETVVRAYVRSLDQVATLLRTF